LFGSTSALSPSSMPVNAFTGEVELYGMKYRCGTSSDGGTRGGLETVD
jgi:hypothetical protein